MENIYLLKKKLTEHFNMIDLSPAIYYLGIRITWDYPHRLIQLSQEAYITNVLQTFGMADCEYTNRTWTLLEKGGHSHTNSGLYKSISISSQIANVCDVGCQAKPS